MHAERVEIKDKEGENKEEKKETKGKRRTVRRRTTGGGSRIRGGAIHVNGMKEVEEYID